MNTQLSQQNDEKLEKENRKSLKYFHGEAGSGGVEEAANAYASASLVAAGAGNSVVAMLSTMNNFVAAFLYIKVPSVIQKMGSRKKAVLLLAFLDAVGWLPLIMLLFFYRPVNPIWLIPCWIFNLIPGMLLAPARSSWLADIVPAATRGRYFGMRSAISGAAYIGTFFVLGYILQLFNGSILQGFGVIFLIACIATFVCFLIYSRIHNTPVVAEKDTDFGFLDFLQETRRKNLGRFILFVALFQFTVYIASPFFAPYMLRDLHFSYMYFALVFSTEFLAKVVIVTFWGKYADKVGNLRVMRIVSLAIPFIPLLWLASPNVMCLVLVQLFSGACWAGFDLCSCNFIYEAAPQGRRLKYIAYHKALTTLFMAIGALTGAYLLVHVRPILGYNILSLFVLSGILRLAVTMAMFPKLREVRGRIGSYQEAPVTVTTTWAGVRRPGLFYRPKEWARFGRPLAPEAIPVQAQIEAATSQGLFYRPREWAHFSKPLSSETLSTQAQAAENSRGLFYNPREWAYFGKPLVPEQASTQPQSRSETLAANWGLFYRPGEWTRFGRPQVTEAIPIQVQIESETAEPKKGLFHKPKEWLKSGRPIAAPNNARQWQQLQPAPVLV